MTSFPSRGQKAPAYWDTQLKAYIDEGDSAPVSVDVSNISNFSEAVEDAVAAMMVSGANVTLSYVDNGTGHGTLQVTAAGGDAEVMRDTIGAALVGTTGIGVAVNDAADTITLSITGVAISQVTGLQAALDAHTNALAGKMDSGIAGLPGGSTVTVVKSGASWPARPTARGDIVVIWKGADPSPSIVTSGTGGMRDQTGGALGDVRFVTP